MKMAPSSNPAPRILFHLRSLALTWITWSALVLVSSNASAQLLDLIPEWLPVCFLPGQSLLEMFTCLQDNVNECFNSTSLEDIIQCSAEAIPNSELTNQADNNATLNGILDFDWIDDVGSFFKSTRSCLDPYVDCVFENNQERQNSIEPCIKSTLSNLTKCARDNAGQCFRNCTDFVYDSRSDATNPFANFFDFDFLSLFTCRGIQKTIVDPVCRTIDCCQPCTEPYADLMECIINDGLDLTFLQCDFECPGEEERRRELRFLREASTPSTPIEQISGGTSKDDNEEDPIVETCRQFAPGLTGRDAEELVARAPFFLPCVHDQFLKVMEENQPPDV